MSLPLMLQHTLNPLLCAYSSRSCWALGTVVAAASIPGTRLPGLIWREVALGHSRGHWPSTCYWREQTAAPNLKVAMAPQWGSCMLPLFFLPHHCITTFFCVLNGLIDWKMLFLSHLKCDVTHCDRLCDCCEESTGSGSPLCHSAGLFQTLTCFLDRNQQHFTGTSYRDSREMNQCSGLAMRFGILASQ